MAENKRFQSRVVNKHDIESNWNKAVSFIPMQGEIIVYDPDDNYDYARIKIGDGIRAINDLEFLLDTQYILHDSNTLSQLLEQYMLNVKDVEETIDNKQDKIVGAVGQFVVIGDDGNATTISLNIAEEVSY